MKRKNPVAKHLRTFNKATVEVDRKKESKTKPKLKHKKGDKNDNN